MRRGWWLLWLCVAALVSPVRAAERAIEKQVVVAATLEQAWAAWTTREGIVSFLAPEAEIEARVGGAFHLYFDPTASPGLKGADDTKFMALQPMRMLSFDWVAPPHLPEARAQRTLVILRFESVSERETRITLHHTGWGDGGQWDQAYKYFDRAWPGVLEKLKRRFDSGPTDWTAYMKQLRLRREMGAASKPKGD